MTYLTFISTLARLTITRIEGRRRSLTLANDTCSMAVY